MKCVMDLSEFDMLFKTRTAIKGQAITDFVTNFANIPKVEEVMEPVEPPLGIYSRRFN